MTMMVPGVPAIHRDGSRDVLLNGCASLTTQSSTVRATPMAQQLIMPPVVMAGLFPVYGASIWPLRLQSGIWTLDGPLTRGRFTGIEDRRARYTVRVKGRGPEVYWPVLGDYRLIVQTETNLARRISAEEAAEINGAPVQWVRAAIAAAGAEVGPGLRYNGIALRKCLIGYFKSKSETDESGEYEAAQYRIERGRTQTWVI